MNVNQITFGKAVSIEVECLGQVQSTSEYRAKYDGSLSAGGIEVVFTTDRSNGPVSVPHLDVVARCKVDNSCGLHVHVDVRDLNRTEAQQVYRKLLTASSILKRLVPSSRLHNRYCRWRANDNGGMRYSAINFQAYHKFQTIEFRMQSGSTERRKIENWAEVCYQLVQWARTSTRRSQLSWKAFMKMLPTDELRRFVVRRTVKLYWPELRESLEAALSGAVLAKEQSDALAQFGLETIGRVRPVARVAQRAEVMSNRVLGYSVCSVLRRMGQEGVVETQAASVMNRCGVTVEPSTVRFMLRAGAAGTGRMAPLSSDQVQALVEGRV